jgi:hypothetical protein
MRVMYEGHKSATKECFAAKKHLSGITELDLNETDTYKIKTPDEYVKAITIDEEVPLGKFLEKIIALGSTQGFVAFMMLYQYMYDNNLLGKEIEELTSQEIINHIYREKTYRLKPKNKQLFFSNILRLSGLQFYMENPERTEAIRKNPGKEDQVVFTSFTLLKVKELHTLSDKKTITALGGVSIMKDFINLWYKKLSRLFIPLEAILKIPSDRNGDHKRGFNLSLALRHAELGNKKDSVEWDLQQCLNVGQWKVNMRFKARAWNQVMESLIIGKNYQLIDYYFIYRPGKPEENRFIEKVIIKRLWKTHAESTHLNFNPEMIKPVNYRKKTKSKAHSQYL